jgi:cytochrome b6-f complex iron-sulfur subunit
MNRKEFFDLLGVAIPMTLVTCNIEACKHDPVIQPTSNVIDFTIDLNDTQYNKLKNQGGFVFIPDKVDIIVVHTIKDEYVAVSARCTHQGSLVAYYPSDIFFCSRHGAKFSTSGTVTQGPAITPLTQFKTQLRGTLLRVFS